VPTSPPDVAHNSKRVEFIQWKSERKNKKEFFHFFAVVPAIWRCPQNYYNVFFFFFFEWWYAFQSARDSSFSILYSLELSLLEMRIRIRLARAKVSTRLADMPASSTPAVTSDKRDRHGVTSRTTSLQWLTDCMCLPCEIINDAWWSRACQ
jgi:hypothetical protein